MKRILATKLVINHSKIQTCKMRKALLLLLIATLVLCSDEEYHGPSEEDVVILDKDNLKEEIYESGSEEAWLIAMHAPWCDHCKKMRPDWAKLATRLKGIAKVASLDASQNRQFDQIFDLKGYPTVVMVPPGLKNEKVFIKYDGARVVDRLEEWALEKITEGKGFTVPRLTSESAWKEYCVDTSRSVCMVALLPLLADSSPEERKIQIHMIRQVLNDFRDKPISAFWAQAGDHPQIENQFALNSGFPAVIMISPNKQLFSVMRSAFTQKNLEEWIKELLSRRGGRKFNSYSRALEFGEVTQDQVDDELEYEPEVEEKQRASDEERRADSSSSEEREL